MCHSCCQGEQETVCPGTCALAAKPLPTSIAAIMITTALNKIIRLTKHYLHFFSWVGQGSVPHPPDNSVSQLLRRLDVELHPDEGGAGVEEKPHQGIQAGVLSAGRNRPEASRPDLPGAQPL